MRPLGFHGFAMVGRDRGDRVVHRTALDHPDVMERIALGAKFWAGCADLWRMAS
jgi:pimeloyl-ACP methyl ester carboxylesterase